MEPWLNNVLTGISALGVAFFAFKYATAQQQFLANEDASATATTTAETQAELPDDEALRLQLAAEHPAELLDSAVTWPELEALMQAAELQRVAVLYCERDRTAIYERLQREGFTGFDIQFFVEPMLIVALRSAELPRLVKLPALYRLVPEPAGEEVGSEEK